ncbi:maleylacetoacetate isomerase [Chitinivorax tropicus]|uniref:Maleylacetoacetate isomerase n=1 Tax=Chitinivorax tropicus TaxID=714531 RepID=A0A840ME11_9PROT|nr:maleylacetoacetate isomerase [Chitinivorax tropicus]MBB5016918.1 maleylacetoacetate isomerase [Chitinivorax tropicus]
MELYTYFRSSAAFRVRIALNLKGLPYTPQFIHLLNHGGEQHSVAYKQLNPAELVPTLIDGNRILTQSLAICEYLEETHPEIPLLPSSPLDRAWVRAIALGIACDIHPINNLRVLQYLSNELAVTDDAKTGWAQHWIKLGFAALENQLAGDARTGLCCLGNTPTLADVCLIPQVFNAQRFQVDMDAYPTLQRIATHCQSLPAFSTAAPAQQPDAA